MVRNRCNLGLLIAFLALLAGQKLPAGPTVTKLDVDSIEAASDRTSVSEEPIRPLPKSLALDGQKVALGRDLFNEASLSRDNSVSCASCHSLHKGGADQRVHSLGINGAEGTLNAPTVFNCGFNFRQFWDGRANSLEEQVDGPLQNPTEMGSKWDDVLGRLRASAEDSMAFGKIYPDGVRRENVKDAIAQYERSLVTPNSRFDKYLRGDKNAITESEKAGYGKFKSYGCASCHQGINVGGNMFATLGEVQDYFNDRGHVTQADFGRFNVTGKNEDKFVFKVPSLRNVALTAPYFHDGSTKTLKEAVQTMAKYQLGRPLSDQSVDEIVQFLKTLTGEFEGKQL